MSARETLFQARIELVPVTLAEAFTFVDRVHRHKSQPTGARFAIGAAVAGEIVGVAIVGRPLAHELQDGWTAEVTRVATDETRNACSKLYAAAWRAWRAMGGRRLVTYNLPSESGASLRAAGYVVVAKTKGREWDTPSRPRVEKGGVQMLDKFRWERNVNQPGDRHAA